MQVSEVGLYYSSTVHAYELPQYVALVTTRSGLQYQKEDMEEGAASVLKSMEEMMIHDRQKREANSR